MSFHALLCTALANRFEAEGHALRLSSETLALLLLFLLFLIVVVIVVVVVVTSVFVLADLQTLLFHPLLILPTLLAQLLEQDQKVLLLFRGVLRLGLSA